jgi:uncharacterized protein with NRDE domain
LTNFREEGVEVNKDKSRGAITNSYLCVPPERDEDDEGYVRRLLNDVGIHDVGGFTLIFGKLRALHTKEDAVRTQKRSQAVSRLNMLCDHQPSNEDGERLASTSNASRRVSSGLAVISNRTDSADSLPRIAGKAGETHGLSNSHFGDLTWPKVVHGELLLKQAIDDDVSRGSDQSRFIESLFDVLSVDTLPKRLSSEDWDAYVRHMKNSIMISPSKGELAQRMANYVPASTSLKASSGTTNGPAPKDAGHSVSETAYGTSKQTVILVNKEGRVLFVERTLYDHDGSPVSAKERELKYDFAIEGWTEDS